MADYIGMFAVTTGLGINKKEKQFEADNDDYSAIMLKALADLFAEAFAEALHARVRRELWGYVPGETLDNTAMIEEKYRGIRPAPGYPACPNHLVKQDMFDVLQANEIGMTVTESLAMLPAASVSGFYIAHPESTYFSVGKIADDQVENFAQRMAISKNDAERALAPLLRESQRRNIGEVSYGYFDFPYTRRDAKAVMAAATHSFNRHGESRK